MLHSNLKNVCVGAGRACPELVEAAREKVFAGMARSYLSINHKGEIR
jgi:hypothetical protein